MRSRSSTHGGWSLRTAQCGLVAPRPGGRPPSRRRRLAEIMRKMGPEYEGWIASTMDNTTVPGNTGTLPLAVLDDA
jgi:hypothetical protein